MEPGTPSLHSKGMSRPFGGFRLPPLPRPDYMGLQWARERLDAMLAQPHEPVSQWEVVCLGIRLVNLLLQGNLDVATVHVRGQDWAVLTLLEHFRRTEPEQDRVAPPHWTPTPKKVAP